MDLSCHLLKRVPFQWRLILGLSTRGLHIKHIALLLTRHICKLSNFIVSLLNLYFRQLIAWLHPMRLLRLMERLDYPWNCLPVNRLPLDILFVVPCRCATIIMFWVVIYHRQLWARGGGTLCFGLLLPGRLVVLMGALKEFEVAKVREGLHRFESGLATYAHI